MNRPKTIFCDIDGTLIKHKSLVTNQSKYKYENVDLLNNTIKSINHWDKLWDKIILTLICYFIAILIFIPFFIRIVKHIILFIIF